MSMHAVPFSADFTTEPPPPALESPPRRRRRASATDRILLVAREERFRRAVARAVRPFARATEFATCEEATRALAGGEPYAAFIVEAELPDGSGLDWLALARISQYRAPALILADGCNRRFLHRAFELDARCLAKPVRAKTVRTFVEDAVAQGRPVGPVGVDVVTGCARRWAREHGLTPCETEIVAAAVAGRMSRQELAASRAISTNTIKTHVKSVLRKMGATSLAEVRERALRAGAIATLGE